MTTVPRRALVAVDPAHTGGRYRDSHALQFLLGALLVADGVALPGLNFPLSLLGVAGLCLLGFSRPPKLLLGRFGWVPWALTLALAWTVAVSLFTPASPDAADWSRRIIRIAAVVLLAFALASERLHLPSVLKGLALALMVNAAAFYAGLAPDTYGGALTGWLGDKNKAALAYSVLGVLLLSQVRRPPVRVLVVVVTAALVWFTGSRTSMTGYAFGLVWLWLVARRAAPVRWASAGGLAAAAVWLEDNLAQTGQFAERWGSDLLRGRIDAASEVKLAGTPFEGLGFGEAYVLIDGRLWYFHNAYWSLLVEGGWVLAVTIVAVTVFVGLRPFEAGVHDYRAVIAQGATVALLIAGWKLGEVFLTNTWGLVLGFALNVVLRHQDERAQAAEPRDG